PPVLAPLAEEGEDARHHGLVVGTRAPEPLEALLGQSGGGPRMAGHGDAVAFDHGLNDRGGAACALTVLAVDLVHGDELLDQRARQIPAALIVAHTEAHLRPAQ